MGIERLISRTAPENLWYCAVLQVDRYGGRIQVSGRLNVPQWVTYEPSDFADLAAGDTVAVGESSAGAFAVRKVSNVLPTDTSVLEV